MSAKAITLTVPVTQEGWVTHLTLALPCRRCEGRGVIDNPETPEDPYPRDGEEIQCAFCEGSGLLITQSGEAILDLVRKFGGAR